MKPNYLAQARKDGVYEMPVVADEVTMRREPMMVTMLHENLVNSQAPEPTEEQLKAFYDAHRAVYVDKEKRTVNIIFNPQERIVRRAADEIHKPSEFVDVAVRYNESASKPEDVRTQSFTIDTPEFKEIAPQAFALKKVGDYSEPFRTSQGWIMMQLASLDPERPFPLEEIRENVTQDVKNQWSEDKLNGLLEEWKKTVKIDVDEGALERVVVERTDVYVPGRPVPAPVEPGKPASSGSTP
jgi:peptidyl-prolyl cis-trans isomerase C